MVVVWERKVLRNIYGLCFENGQVICRSNTELMEIFGEPNIILIVKEGRFKQLGHVKYCMDIQEEQDREEGLGLDGLRSGG